MVGTVVVVGTMVDGATEWVVGVLVVVRSGDVGMIVSVGVSTGPNVAVAAVARSVAFDPPTG